MAISDIEFIKKSIRMHLMDLHILITHDQVNVDIEYYNDVTLALLKAEDTINMAAKSHEERIQKYREKYSQANHAVD